MIIVSILTIILAFLSIDFKALKNKNSLGFSKDNTLAFRGLLALTVILCHLSGKLDYQLPIFGFSVMGAMAVGAFFMFSGYALYKNTLRYESYLDNFLYNRFVKILFPFFVMVIIYLLLMCLVAGEPIKAVIDSFRYGYPISNTWYVFAILFLYFVYWIAFKGIKANNFAKSFALLIFTIFVYCLIIKFAFEWRGWWYKTIFLFPIGILFAKFESKITAFIQKRYLISFFIVSAFLVFTYILPALSNMIFKKELPYIWDINDILMGLAFPIFTIVLLTKFNFNNKITNFLGSISYEIYIFHGLIMSFLLTKIINFPMLTHLQQELYAIVVFIVTVAIAFVIHKLSSYVIPKLLKKGK